MKLSPNPYFPIIASHYDEISPFEEAWSVELPWRGNLSFLLNCNKGVSCELKHVIRTNWIFEVLLVRGWASPKVDGIVVGKKWKSLQFESIFGWYCLDEHGFAVEFHGSGIVLVLGIDSSKNEDVMCERDYAMACSAVVVVFDRVIDVAYVVELALDGRFEIGFHLI